jgi:FKBP-type peptidyl-prolyl cis-trans isomerase
MKYRVVLVLITVSALCSVIFSGCSKTPDVPSPEEALQTNLEHVDQARLQADIIIINDSLAKKSIVPQIEPNGVRYVVHTQGTGEKPTLASNILINYKGKLLKNQSVFDQGTNSPLVLSQLIIGWQTTLPLINEGSKVTLYIPSGFAYGGLTKYDNDNNVLIPANSILVFEIELLKVF